MLVMALESDKFGFELQFNFDQLDDLGEMMSSLSASTSSSVNWGLT